MYGLSKKVLIAIALTIAFVCFSRVLFTLDLALYDFNFLLKAEETIDERIVLVEWDESSIQMLDEATISDDVLVALLKKISDKPRIIGLDLFRDVPVFSPRLSDEQNLVAYQALQEIFATTTNLIGIEKVGEPAIAPPTALKKRNLVTSADIPGDRDNVIRRGYITPQEDKDGKPAGVPYLGTVLGTQYLAREGWIQSSGDNLEFILSKNDRDVTIKPLNYFAGIPSPSSGFSFLVNWRKGQIVERISVIDVVSGRFDPSLFEDKIVLIGNVSTSTADKHLLPTKRWLADEPLSYGVEIPAQVASSIVSAALDRRNFLNPTPLVLNLLILVAVALLTIWVVLKYSLSREYQPATSIVFFQSLQWLVVVSFCLILLNIILFSLGWWMPVADILFAAWLSGLTICYRYYFKKHIENEKMLSLMLKDVQHYIESPVSSIKSSNEKIEEFTKALEDRYGISTEIDIIYRKINNIYDKIENLQKYKKRTEDYIYATRTDTNKEVLLQSIDINDFTLAIANRCLKKLKTKKSIDLHTQFDSNLVKAMVNTNILEIVLENILDNAVYAVSKKDNPIISIKTHLYPKKKKIEFYITNNGPEIPKSIKKGIFHPFVSYSNSQGLGLYLASEFLRLSNGKISYTSTNEETTFKFVLPFIEHL